MIQSDCPVHASRVPARIHRLFLGLPVVRRLRKQKRYSSAVACRRARETDAPAILHLLVTEAKVEGLTGERIADMILSPQECMYVAEYQGQLVGHVRAGQYWMEPYGVAGQVVMGLVVARDYRGRGIAERLLKCLLTELAQVDRTRVLLTVHRKNRPAIALYRKLGFGQAGIQIPDVFRSAGHLGMERVVGTHEGRSEPLATLPAPY